MLAALSSIILIVNQPGNIGKVKLTYLPGGGRTDYSDGEHENTLLKLAKTSDFEGERQKVLSGNPEWPILYHLSYARENLLNWFDFTGQESVLEVGAGCGALTGLLLRSCNQVTALELTSRRAQIIANRYKHTKNLEILVGNLQAAPADSLYDLVTCIGVLEYAESFIESNSPPEKFLGLLCDQLKPGGKVLVAIENRLGIKYWSGAPEDHTHRPFDSIENYGTKSGIRTFGRKELSSLLSNAGFDELEYYYPLPDYKLPVEVFSETFHPGKNATGDSSLWPSPSPDQKRDYIFSEPLAMRSIIRNGLFEDFTNSYLVVGTKK